MKKRKEEVTGPYEHRCQGKRRKGNDYNIPRLSLLYSFVSSFLFSPCRPHSFIEAAIQKRKGHFSWRRTRSQQLLWPYLLILLSSFRLCPDPLSLTRVTGLFFRNSFQPWWIYQAPTAFDLGFWCCLPLLTSTLGAALHHIDFSEDETLIEQTSLGGRGDPTHVLHRYRIWKRRRPARLTGKRTEANEPAHLIPHDLYLNESFM